MVRYGQSPQQIRDMPMPFVASLLGDEDAGVITFADSAALDRYMANKHG